MNEVLERLSRYGVVPVVVINDPDKAKPLGNVLCKGGLSCAEVTFRTAAAEESIRIISENFPDMLVGAGTVLSVEQVDRAINAGARFIVSPGFDPEIVDYCISQNITVLPGVATATEVMQAVKRGLEVVKFFPAEQAGGLPMIKALAAPFSSIKFMPTGGINASNLTEYLRCDRIVSCGGSWMVKKELVDNDDFEKIEELTKEAVRTVNEVRVSVK